MRYRNVIFGCFGLFVFDQLTKYFFCDLGMLKDSWLIDPVVNYGISWGVSANRWMIIIVSFFGLGLFYWLWEKKSYGDFVFGFLLAGTFGNLFDRIFFGCVRDFISIGNFPVFNMADCYLTFGVILILVKNLLGRKNENKN